MILNKELVLRYKECIECIESGEMKALDCDTCRNKDVANMHASDLCETLEHVWAERDRLLYALKNIYSCVPDSIKGEEKP